MDPGYAATLLAVGLAAGFVSALFGVGGGIVMVPVLHYVLGIAWHDATAVSLAAIAIMSPTAVMQHARRASVDWRIAGWLAAAGVAGTFVGQWLEPRTPVSWLKFAFALLMVLAAHRLVVQAPPAVAHRQPVAILLLVGAVAGVASKLLGIGGGIVTVPALALLGLPIHLAVGSSLVPVFTNAFVATAAKLATGAALWAGVVLAVGGLFGVPLGAKAAHALPAARLKGVVAGALLVVALYVGGTSGAF